MGLLGSLFGGGGFSSGGIGNSESKQTNSTESTDASVIGGDRSVNASIRQEIAGTGHTVTSTDHGAVAGGLQLALQGIEGAQVLAREAQAASGSILTGALNMASAQNKQHAASVEAIKTGDTRTLFLGALALAGLLGFMALRKG